MRPGNPFRARLQAIVWTILLAVVGATAGAQDAADSAPDETTTGATDDGLDTGTGGEGDVASPADTPELDREQPLTPPAPRISPLAYRPSAIGMSAQLNYIFGSPRLHPVDTTGQDKFSFTSSFQFISTQADQAANKDVFYMDGVLARLTPEIAWGFYENWELALRFPLVWRAGATRIVDENVTVLDNRHGGAGLNGIELDVKWKMIDPEKDDDGFAGLIGVASFKIPTGQTNELVSSGQLDLTGAFTGAFRISDWRLHVGIGFTYIGPTIDGAPNQHFLSKSLNISNTWMVGLNAVGPVLWDNERPLLFVMADWHFYGASLEHFIDGIGTPLHDFSAGARLVLTETMELSLSVGITAGKHGVDFISSLSFSIFELN